ncbi:DUF4349 domain-containing protein [Cohnella suwonensis]|uniref:DUF4349 domain-containing protein n=1 Tax=Cohnella suwonensis TaxID=696072 RepID=A0ABW0LN05_9BACL
MKETTVRSIRRTMLLAIALLLALGLAACSGSNDDSDSGKADAPMADAMELKQVNGDQANAAFSEAAPAAEAAAPDQEAMSSSEPVASASTTAASASGSGEAGTAGIGQIADANAGFDRKVIYKANLVMKVEQFKTAEVQLTDLIHLSGAYVLQFSDSRNVDEVGATYVIKVPSEGFSSFLGRLQKIKSLDFQRQVEGSDVTEEYVDLASRLKAKQVVEARLLAFMDKATKTDDLVRFSNELAQVQEEIEQIKGRVRFLDQNVAFSTISLRLYQATGLEPKTEVKEEEKDKGFGDKLSDALSGSANVLRKFGEGILIVLAALLPVLIVVAVVGIPAYVAVRRRSASRKRLSEERRKSWNNAVPPAGNAEPDARDDNTGIERKEETEEPEDGGR